MRRFLSCVALLGIAACSPRGEISFVPDAAPIGVRQEVFVGTTRAIDPETGRFGGDRVPVDSYARYVVQIPRDRSPGTIEWPKPNRQPDPAREFVTVEEQIYDDVGDFRSALTSAVRSLPRGEREVVVFVHGFNTTFSEGLYRIAQLDHDLDLPGVVVHYSWPSRGKPLAYVQDRDSAIYARDGYEQLLTEIAGTGAENIVIAGHSMGALLTMETLRQMSIGKNRKVLDRLNGVILIAPDIDVDVFHQQAVRIGDLPQPFYVFTSQRDRALALSSRLTGRRDRLGNLTEPEEISDIDVTLLDLSEIKDGADHFAVGDSPALIGLLRRLADVGVAFNADRSGNPDLISGTVLTFRQATQIILSPITTIAEEIGN